MSLQTHFTQSEWDEDVPEAPGFKDSVSETKKKNKTSKIARVDSAINVSKPKKIKKAEKPTNDKSVSKNAFKKLKRKSKNNENNKDIIKNDVTLSNVQKKLEKNREEVRGKIKSKKRKEIIPEPKNEGVIEEERSSKKKKKRKIDEEIENDSPKQKKAKLDSSELTNNADILSQVVSKTEKNREKRMKRKNRKKEYNEAMNASENSKNKEIEQNQQNVSKDATKQTAVNSQKQFENSKTLKQERLKNKYSSLLSQNETNGSTSLSQKNKNLVHEPKNLRQRMLEKLKGARFRFLNEQMYCKESKDAKKLFNEDPNAFSAYHEGYRQQVNKWPLNPLDIIIKSISALPKEYTVADLGCGDGRLSKSVSHKVHSFDLVSLDPCVKACDMAHTPLLSAQVNVVVFCLSLMGTNLKDYIIEANRVLKTGGSMKIAEVESRFDNVEEFTKDIQKFGFKLVKSDLTQNLFYFMDFKKDSDIVKRNKLPQLTLNPCLYKRR